MLTRALVLLGSKGVTRDGVPCQSSTLSTDEAIRGPRLLATSKSSVDSNQQPSVTGRKACFAALLLSIAYTCSDGVTAQEQIAL